MAKGYCKTCDEHIDLSDSAFVDYDEYPMVLDIQLKGTPTMRKAINYVLKNHGIDPFDYRDNDGRLEMFHYDKVGRMSHEEPGDDAHILEIPKSGYWSFQ